MTKAAMIRPIDLCRSNSCSLPGCRLISIIRQPITVVSVISTASTQCRTTAVRL